jgi:guanosine-3',5'-bis(diphosphate) 3'-pyrophosphohydrolase
MEKQFKELLSMVKSYSDSKDDFKLIKKAWEFTKLAHTGQKRKTGDPYASHGLATGKVLADWKLDTPSIIAGFLHDAIEDGGAKREDIVDEFGKEIARLVDGVTNVSSLKLRGSEDEEFVENLRKMFLAMAKDIRVVLIKLADRLHNMETLSALPPAKQKRIARETLEVYAPLAYRLGMGEVTAQLDDLAFLYVYPSDYKRVKKQSAIQYKKAEEYIRKMKRSLLKELAKENIKAEIDGRKKHLYSLFNKLKRPEISWDFDKIYDIVALRILVDTVPECYTALGLVHSFYKPVPHLGVSDFIAQPKPNGYQSIHTKVFDPGRRIAEVQIRTHKMHEHAEYGIAAHWAYVLAKSEGIKDEVLEVRSIIVPEGKLSWVKQLVKWQKEITDSKEFLKAVKFDALRDRKFVFSPKGDVYDLPADATPVDFAYEVHTGLGRYIKAAKVNGKIAPLDRKLNSGDVVEILKTKVAKKPSRDWLNFVVTTTAKRKISKDLRRKD